MKFLLDTNTCIRYMNGRSPQLVERFKLLVNGEAVICSVVKAELLYGAARSQNPSKTLANQQQFLSLFASLPFDDVAAEYYGRIRAHLANAGTPIGGNDLLIASIALANNLTLVTHNTREFNRVPDLKIEDWEANDTI